jgi:hypothetical protein
MTPTELRALDLFIAEMVMGWKRRQEFEHSSDMPANDEFYVRAFDSTVIYGPHICESCCGHIFAPTESPADAMMVLKKVLKKMSAGRSIVIEDTGEETCISELSDDMITFNDTSAPTLELAICLFAREVTT